MDLYSIKGNKLNTVELNSFKKEREIWMKYKDKDPLIDCYFIKCDNLEKFTDLYNNCKESYKPGIYQKTILSLKKLNGYDFYVRTNLSSFLIFDNLHRKLQDIDINKPYYSGVYCQPDRADKQNVRWVGGFGIILNKKARNILVKEC